MGASFKDQDTEFVIPLPGKSDNDIVKRFTFSREVGLWSPDFIDIGDVKYEDFEANEVDDGQGETKARSPMECIRNLNQLKKQPTKNFYIFGIRGQDKKYLLWKKEKSMFFIKT